MARRLFTVSLVALLLTTSMLAVAVLTAEAATVIQEFGFGTSSETQEPCPNNPGPNQPLCETRSLSGQVFGSPIQHGTFTGTMVLGAVDPGSPVQACSPFTGTMALSTNDPANVQSVLALTLSGMDCKIGVGPGGGCIVGGTFMIEGAASTGQFQGASGQGRFGALIGPNGEVALALRSR